MASNTVNPFIDPRERVAMETLTKERERASFNIREMTHYLNGGEEKTHYRELATKLLERDPEMRVDHFFDKARPEARTKCMIQLRRFNELRLTYKDKDPLLERYIWSVSEEYDRSFGMRAYVHEVLFRESIWAQGTKEQWKKWEDDILCMRVIGCYSMTEFGHSSNLQGLETTATFDKKNQEFIIHSPTITSTKWWIGMAGQTATHTVALCQTIIDGKSVGLNWFIVPLRSRQDGRLLPGVTCGDIGAKAGRNGLDNGWIQFSHVRVPRDNMLMKWAQVSTDGIYTPPPNQTLVYASLIGERLLVVPGLYTMVSQAATIAVRYGAARRQGHKDQQILDFQGFQVQLLPVLATLYAANASDEFLRNTWERALSYSQDPATQKKFLEMSHDMHAVTAGLKAWLGWWGTDALEVCRRSLGGHGYSAYNAIAGLIGDYGVFTTGGGDNIVLGQQTARYLVGSLQRVVSGKQVTGSVDFLNNVDMSTLSQGRMTAKKGEDLLASAVQLEALKWLSVKLIAVAASDLQNSMGAGSPLDESWNANMMSLLDCSKAYAFYFLANNFVNVVSKMENKGLQPVLKRLSDLFALSCIEKLIPLFVEQNYIDSKQISLIKKQVVALVAQVRPDAVALVDAFAFPDWILKAPVGRYDGAIYTHYHQILKEAPEGLGVPSYWKESIAPLVQKGLPESKI